MNPAGTSRARIVFLKELRETFRDRRVLLSVIVSPLLVTPLLLAVMGFFVGQKTTQDLTEVLEVALVDAGGVSGLLRQVETDPTLAPTRLSSVAEAEAAVRDRSIRAALIVPETAMADFETGGTARLEIVYDASNEKSSTARGRLHQAVHQFQKAVMETRLADRGLPGEFLEPARVTDRNLATEKATGGFILGIILPYVVILTASFGGLTSALDLIAGEKEKGTLETLLVSPASRQEIIIGKLGAVCAISVVAGLCSIAGLIATIEIGVRLTADLIPVGIAISYASVAAMLLAIIPLTLTTSALLLVSSAIARNPKEAQAYVFPFMIVIIVPAMLSFILPAESGRMLSLVPILNTAMVMKQVLTGLLRPDFIALATISSLLYAGLALRLVVALFQKESILFRI